MKKKWLLAVLIVLIVAGVVGACLYFSKTMLQSGKDIVFQYLETDVELEKEEVAISDFTKKQTEEPYNIKGEVKLSVTGNSVSEEIVELLKTAGIRYEFDIDEKNEYIDGEIGMTAQGISIPMLVKKDGNTFGIQSSLLNEKYVAVKNENLDLLVKRFIPNAEGVPSELNPKNFEFTEEEMNQLGQKYNNLLKESFDEEEFKKKNENGQTIVTLTITKQKFVEVAKTVLATLRDDEILRNKTANIKEYERTINATINDLEEIEFNDKDVAEFVFYMESDKLSKLEVAFKSNGEIQANGTANFLENKIEIEFEAKNNFTIKTILTKESNDNDIIYSMNTALDLGDGLKTEMKMVLEYKNIFTSNDVAVNFTVTEDMYDYDELSMTIELRSENKIRPITSVEIERFDDSNVMILNDATDEEIQALILGIYQKLGIISE